jgi:hypothetical protein
MPWDQIIAAAIALVVGWLSRHYTMPKQPTPTPTPTPQAQTKTPVLDALRSFLSEEQAIDEDEALAVLYKLVKPSWTPPTPPRAPVGA